MIFVKVCIRYVATFINFHTLTTTHPYVLIFFTRRMQLGKKLVSRPLRQLGVSYLLKVAARNRLTLEGFELRGSPGLHCFRSLDHCASFYNLRLYHPTHKRCLLPTFHHSINYHYVTTEYILNINLKNTANYSICVRVRFI